ncbi:helix-turn-helix domain-containing protein [Occultella gossypii]|uniref:Helix-turn-helix domain-containing protein n=1 Tax=Occultella gossypii TaxID=2800820 RepID=A0ABS7SCJ7_9MICO|nr:helix-turn-helix domain-containing protein [Occultella gossypii]MBZ2198094.1 helix-turn-helix domain-containing protein [Occultella gossypii]
MRTTQPMGAQHNQALARGLEVLRLLVAEGVPLTATEIAHRMGLHQTSISRILATLNEVGYARKTPAGFTPDFGVLSLAAASAQFPLITRPRAVMQSIAARAGGMNVSLGMLWRGQMIYFLPTTHAGETADFWWLDYPLFLSAPGLRLVADMPDDQALALLRASRERHGRRGNEDRVPQSDEEVLRWTREHTSHDVLILQEWSQPGETSAAIPLNTGEEYPVALALAGPSDVADAATLRLWLHDFRRDIETALAGPPGVTRT